MSFGSPVRNGLGIGLTPSTTLSSGARAVTRPALLLNFIGTTSLDSRVTFTRATTATFVGSNGLIQTAAIDAPRFDYDPVTLAAKGLLIEEQRTNIVLYSQQFGDAAWLKSITTVTENTTVSPDGTANADTYAATASGAGAARQVYQISKTLTAIPYTWSVYAKAKELNWLVINAFDGTNRATYFNLANGTVGTVAAGDTASIQNAGNGWYRCLVTRTAAATANGGVSFELTTGDNVLPINANLTAGFGIFLYGAQLEAGAFATSYIPTVASTVTRSADAATMTGTNFSSWYNQSEGTFVASFRNVVDPAAGGKAVFSTNDGTNNNRVTLLTTTTAAEGRIVVGGVATNPVSRGFTGGSVAKSGIAFAAGSGAQYTNGVLNSAVTPSAAPTVNRLEIGANLTSSFLNGHIRQIAYYNTRLPNATLQALTA